jgi:hypothetical protein
VRFDTGGNWLLIGNDEGYLVLWSVKINTAVAHTQCSAKSAAAVAAAAGDEAGGAASAAGDGGSSVTVPQVGSWQLVCYIYMYVYACVLAGCAHKCSFRHIAAP